MKRPAKFITLMTLVLFAACTGRDLVSDIPIVNFEGSEERAFDVTEILEDPKLVRLETNEKALVNRADFAVGEKWIITVSRENILQFTGEGAFVRVLAQRGQGPLEFLNVQAFFMDDKEQKLYIDHSGSKANVLVFDLNSGSFDRIIKKPLAALGPENGFSITNMMVVNDSMYCIPERSYPGEAELYIQRTSGEFLASFPRNTKLIRAGGPVSAKPFLAVEPETNNIRYMSRGSDTLFSISGTTKKPYAAISYQNKFAYEQNVTEIIGNMVNMLGEGPSGILFEKLIFTAKQSKSGSRIGSVAAGGLYFSDKADFTPVKISALVMDHLEFPVEANWEQSKDKVLLAVPAVSFKDMLRSAIERSSGNPEAQERWRSLDKQVSENDNPVLLMGKLK